MRVALFLLALILSGSIFGQSDVVMSNGILNPVLKNPAFAGSENSAFATFQLRSQWTGFETTFDGSGGAPNTQMISASVPVIGGLNGFGLIVQNDALGPVTNFTASIPVSFSFAIGNNNLGIGISPGVVSTILDFNQLRFADPSDPLNLGTSESQTNFNIGAGIFYDFSGKLLVSAGVANITEPEFNFGNSDLSYKSIRNYNLLVRYRMLISSQFQLVPTLNVNTDLRGYTIDAGSLAFIGDKIWTGILYRWAESIIAMVGYTLLPEDNLHIGFSMDIVLDQVNAKQLTSQEIYIKYIIPGFILGGRKQVKTPRFTY